MNQRDKRRKRIRRRIYGTAKKPRVSVFRSNKHIYVQVVDDVTGHVLESASDLSLKGDIKAGNKTDTAKVVGEKLGTKMKKKKMTKVSFDRGGYKYHGRVKALAEGLRSSGIKF